jgi:hypothetical protein
MNEYVPVDAQANVFGAEIKSDYIDEGRAVDLELRVGECHFHDAWTLHNSRPNTSEMRRCGYTMRYMPSNAVFHPHDDWAKSHKIYLVRGEDRSGGKNVYAPVPSF